MELTRAANKSLRHGGPGLMSWAVANARVAGSSPAGEKVAGMARPSVLTDP